MEITSKNYLSTQTAGLSANPGEPVRYRVPQLGDTFWLASGNFVSAPTVSQYAKTTANDTRLTPAASEDADGATYVVIETSKQITTGTVNPDTLYLCRVVALA